MRRIAHGNVQFVCSHNLQRRIPIFPPELMSDHGDFNGAIRLGRVLDTGNYARSRQKEDDHNENRHYGPRQFQLSAAVYLRGFASIGRLLPELHHRVSKQSENNEEYRACNLKDEDRKIDNRLGRSGRRSEYVRRTQKWTGEKQRCDEGSFHEMSVPQSPSEGLRKFRPCQRVSHRRIHDSWSDCVEPHVFFCVLHGEAPPDRIASAFLDHGERSVMLFEILWLVFRRRFREEDAPVPEDSVYRAIGLYCHQSDLVGTRRIADVTSYYSQPVHRSEAECCDVQ